MLFQANSPKFHVQLEDPKCNTFNQDIFMNCQGDPHIGHVCSGCQTKIYGFRYKCIICPNYELCGRYLIDLNLKKFTLIKFISQM